MKNPDLIMKIVNVFSKITYFKAFLLIWPQYTAKCYSGQIVVTVFFLPFKSIVLWNEFYPPALSLSLVLYAPV